MTDVISYLKIFHSKVNAISIPVGDPEIARPGCTGANHHRVVSASDSLCINIYTYVGIWNKHLEAN